MQESPIAERLEVDVVVVGGGAAGLSAALLLGRSRRRTVVIDAGAPRNLPTPRSHSFFTRDGAPPAELLRIGREDLLRYPTVRILEATATGARRTPEGRFEVETSGGATCAARRVILATGVRDELPPTPGVRERWGVSVFHCPYCHGYEAQDEPIAVLAEGEAAVQQARLIRVWTDDVVVFTDGRPMGAEERATLARLGVGVREERVARLVGEGRDLEAVELEGGERVPRRAALLRPPFRQASGLPATLGCALTPAGHVQVGPTQETSVPGVFAAGDCARPMQQLVLAAADGATAAIAVNHGLMEETFPRAP